MSILEIIFAIFFPPIAVLIRFGLSGKLLINIILTLLGGLPGVIHAFYVISKDGPKSKVTV